jgi:hypothetical protein
MFTKRLLQPFIEVLVEMEEWSEKEKVIKQKGRLRAKKETEKIFIDLLTKQEREIQKRKGKRKK